MNSFLLAPEPEPEQFFLFLTEAGAVPKLAGSETLLYEYIDRYKHM